MLPWEDRFLDSARRRGLSSNSIALYSHVLQGISNKAALNLETCSQEDLTQFLNKINQKYSPAYYMLHVVLIKKALLFLNRRKLADIIERPKLPDRASTIKVISPEDRRKLIAEAPTLQDRLIIELFDETGARRGELCRLKVKDVQFDEHGAVLTLDGKTGVRRRRVYASTADLRRHINDHPERNNPDAPLLRKLSGKPFTNHDLWERVRWLGERILKKRIRPHLFRHSKATEDASIFTDREMMLLYGWKTPSMVGVYSHLSMRDVEEKDLALHGLKRREEVLRPLTQIQRCSDCGEENAPIAVYCTKCSAILPSARSGNADALLSDPKFVERLAQNQQFLEALKKALTSTRACHG